MDDQTQIISRENPKGESHFLQISIRGWLAIALVSAVVINQICIGILAVSKGDASLLKIGEPLYTMSGMALAYYFGQKPSTKPTNGETNK